MADATIATVRRVLWRTVGPEPGLLAGLEIAYDGGGTAVVAEGDARLAGYTGTVEPYAPADVLRLIDDERDRRIAAGIEYPPGSGRMIQTRAQDQANVSQQMLRAVALIALGTPEAWGDRSWLDASNANPLPLPTPQAMVELGVAVGDRKEALIYAGYGLKARVRAGETVDWASDASWLPPA